NNPILQEVGSNTSTLENNYRIGFGLRPFGNTVTITTDFNVDKRKSGDESNLIYGLELWSKRGFSVAAKYDDIGNFEFGVEVGFPKLGIRNSNSFITDAGTHLSSATVLESRERYRETSLKLKGRYLELTLKGDIPDSPQRGYFFSRGPRTTAEWVRLIEKARGDDSVNGIILNIGRFGGGMATVSEIRNALLRFKEDGKNVIVYAEILTGKGLLLASAADMIIMNPSGYLYFTGLTASISYYKGLLDKIGVEVEYIRVGRYKSAVEPFSFDSMSYSFREELDAILDDYQNYYIDGISEGRNRSKDDIRTLQDNGPFTASEALKSKLIDKIAYEDEIDEIIKKKYGLKSIVKIKARDYEKRKKLKREWSDKKKIAIIHLSGAIIPGESRGGSLLGAKTASRIIKYARKDPSIKAIILRIDSGGGTALGADIIWNELKHAKGKKPIIASFGDIAASGAYYLAMPADTILAEKTTLTGSIGIFMALPKVKELYKKLGIRQEVIKRGKHSDILSANRMWTEEEKELFQRQIDELYQDFVNKVSEGRGMTSVEVDSVGMGRLWTGEDALDIGLIDVIGGMREAENLSLKMTGLNREDVEFVTFSASRRSKIGIGTFLQESVSNKFYTDDPLIEAIIEEIGFYGDLLTLMKEAGLMLMLPYELEIE
ncbi:MAG: signal peptide peptidase SppA, partial [Candidatus Marinimicrobia bacterium]|nr:signal peptide peptidase SppA [Candidatus Neomarinimicrobiota bacterium]